MCVGRHELERFFGGGTVSRERRPEGGDVVGGGTVSRERRPEGGDGGWLWVVVFILFVAVVVCAE